MMLAIIILHTYYYYHFYIRTIKEYVWSQEHCSEINWLEIFFFTIVYTVIISLFKYNLNTKHFAPNIEARWIDSILDNPIF